MNVMKWCNLYRTVCGESLFLWVRCNLPHTYFFFLSCFKSKPLVTLSGELETTHEQQQQGMFVAEAQWQREQQYIQQHPSLNSGGSPAAQAAPPNEFDATVVPGSLGLHPEQVYSADPHSTITSSTEQNVAPASSSFIAVPTTQVPDLLKLLSETTLELYRTEAINDDLKKKIAELQMQNEFLSNYLPLPSHETELNGAFIGGPPP